MRPTDISCFTLLATLALASSRRVLIPDRGCVSSFRTASNHFEICKAKVCFVLLPEKPYVIPDPEFKCPPSGLFPCLGNNASSGVFFDVLKRAGGSVHELEEAMCIYGGPNCSFDNLIHFVEDVMKFEPTYRIIAGGLFLFLPHRRTQYTVPSQPWFSGKMMVVFCRDDGRRSFESAWKQVTQPFSIEGWKLLILFMCIFCIALGIHAYRFSPAKTFMQLIRWFSLSNTTARGVSETASWTSLRLAVIVFLTVSVLLYEVSFLNSSDSDNIKNIEELRSYGLRNFAIVEGDASEAIFRHAFGWENKTGDVPWMQVKTLDDAIALVRNKTVKYAFSLETAIHAMLLCERMGDSISATPMVKRDYGGWYYAIGIPPKLRQKIDKALGTLVLEDLPRKSLEVFEISPVDCQKRTHGLDYKVVLFILLWTVVPILLYHIGACILPYSRSDAGTPAIPTYAEPNMDPDAV